MSDPLLLDPEHSNPALTSMGAPPGDNVSAEDPKLWNEVRTRTGKIEFVAEPFYFYLAHRIGSMFAPDGTRLIFDNQIHKTVVKNHIRYLLEEIHNGHPSLTEATDKQVHAYEMLKNPRGVIAAEIRPQIEEEVRKDLEIKIRAQMEAEYAGIAAQGEDARKLSETDRPQIQSVDIGNGAKLTPVSTMDIAKAMSGSTSTPGGGSSS